MHKLTLKSKAEIEIMRAGGLIIAEIVEQLSNAVVVDTPTIEFDKLARDLCKQYKVTSGTLGYHGYPSAVCISINNELVHGIPSAKRKIASGDIVKVDMVIVHQGYFLDHAVTLAVGQVSEIDRSLINITKLATLQAVANAKSGNKVGDLSFQMQNVVELAGFNVARQMTGHGIGRSMHEEPEILCYGQRGTGLRLQTGMVLAIETMAMTGEPELEIDVQDGWTARTIDGSTAAHFEHTVAITDRGPLVLTEK
jgi:methionyl aminopeptidase